jgi:signal transduction histidine kinase
LFLTNPNDANTGPIHDDTNHESQGKREQFVSELIHEFTNVITAVIGYSELALQEIDRCHPAREWLEKMKNHAKQLVSLVRKLTALSSQVKRATNDEC